ncbi:undecaprenyl diphosphate synthase family protein, partial [Shewanella sp. C32]
RRLLTDPHAPSQARFFTNVDVVRKQFGRDLPFGGIRNSFSSENWRRPDKEVSLLMELLRADRSSPRRW